MALDKSKLEMLMHMRSQQHIGKSYGSTDPNFPLFTTPVGKNLLVYIPTMNVIVHEDGTEENPPLETVVHDWRAGKQFGTIPCISGIPDDDPLAMELGYSGHTCPACDATIECWELVDRKITAFAKEMNIDPQNDTTDTIKNQRSQFIQDMAIKNHNTYVTFPIVVIPHEKMIPTKDAVNNLEAYFVTMTKSRYTDKVLKSLGSLMTNKGHIGGRFMFWQFVYDTKGKQPNARDAARNATFNIIVEAEALQYCMPLKEACEERAKEFTNLKALEVLPALACKSYAEILNETNKAMKQTRLTLAAYDNVGQAQGLPNGAPENILQSFGATQVGNSNPVATNAENVLQSFGASPVNLGVGESSDDNNSSGTPVTRFG